jgi:hypothetical protein
MSPGGGGRVNLMFGVLAELIDNSGECSEGLLSDVVFRWQHHRIYFSSEGWEEGGEGNLQDQQKSSSLI